MELSPQPKGTDNLICIRRCVLSFSREEVVVVGRRVGEERTNVGGSGGGGMFPNGATPRGGRRTGPFLSVSSHVKKNVMDSCLSRGIWSERVCVQVPGG